MNANNSLPILTIVGLIVILSILLEHTGAAVFHADPAIKRRFRREEPLKAYNFIELLLGIIDSLQFNKKKAY